MRLHHPLIWLYLHIIHHCGGARRKWQAQSEEETWFLHTTACILFRWYTCGLIALARHYVHSRSNDQFFHFSWLFFYHLSSTKHFWHNNCLSRDVFFLFVGVLHQTLETVKKSQDISSIWNTQPNIHATVKVNKITFSPSILMFAVNVTWRSWSVCAWFYALHCLKVYRCSY